MSLRVEKSELRIFVNVKISVYRNQLSYYKYKILKYKIER